MKKKSRSPPKEIQACSWRSHHDPAGTWESLPAAWWLIHTGALSPWATAPHEATRVVTQHHPCSVLLDGPVEAVVLLPSPEGAENYRPACPLCLALPIPPAPTLEITLLSKVASTGPCPCDLVQGALWSIQNGNTKLAGTEESQVKIKLSTQLGNAVTGPGKGRERRWE